MVEPRNEIRTSTSRALLKKGITLLFVRFPSSSPECSKKFPVMTRNKGVGCIIVEQNGLLENEFFRNSGLPNVWLHFFQVGQYI